MKFKNVICLMLIISVLLCGCSCSKKEEIKESESHLITDAFETQKQTEEYPNTEKAETGCFDIPYYHQRALNSKLNAMNISAKSILKIHTTTLFSVYKYIPESSNISEWRQESSKSGSKYESYRYFVDCGNQKFKTFECNKDDPTLLEEIDLNGNSHTWFRYTDWSIAYEYIFDPSNVFGENVTVHNIYCVEDISPYDHIWTCRDIFIYYETDKGNYLLYIPYEYEINNTDDSLDPFDWSNREKAGYSDTVYLMPQNVPYQAFGEMIKYYSGIYYDHLRVEAYEGESQLYKLIDLEPYKLVPGQLPK